MTQSEAYLLTIDKAMAKVFAADAPLSLMETIIGDMPTNLWATMLDNFGYEMTEDEENGGHYIRLKGDRIGGRYGSAHEAFTVALEHIQENANAIDVLEWLNKRLAETKADHREAFNNMTGNPIAALNNLSIRKVA